MSRATDFVKQPANGRQLNLIFALAMQAGIKGWPKILEWLEYDSGLQLQYSKPEEIHAVNVDRIVRKLQER